MTDRVAFGPGRKAELARWLYHEFQRVRTARTSLEEQWRDWLEQYRAPQAKSIKQFPFEAASDETYPLSAQMLDPVLAHWMTTIHAPENLWSLKPLNAEWIQRAKPLQDYLQWIDKNMLNMWDVNYRVGMEAFKLGTGIYKVYWKFEQSRITGYDQARRRTRLVKSINQPAVDHVPLANFFIPPEAIAIDPDEQGGAQWVAERVRYRPDQLRQLARGQEPFLPNFDPDAVKRVLAHEELALTEHQEKVVELEQVDPTISLVRRRPIEFLEFHLRYDVGRPPTDNPTEEFQAGESDIIALYHWETQEILRAIHNPFAHGKRPYHAIRYLRADGFYGIGICEQSEMWQNVTTKLMNNTIDKTELTNAPMLKVKQGANVLPNEPIFPTKLWALEDPRNDLEPLFLTDGRGNFDYIGLMNFLLEGAKQRTGVTDLRLGNISGLPSRTPATTVQSLLQESNTRFDLSIKDMRLSGLANVGLQVLQLLQQEATDVINNPDADQYIQLAPIVLGQPEGQFVAQSLQIPTESIEFGVGVELTATSGTSNKELQKQSMLSLMQVLSQIGPQFIQLGQIAQQSAQTPLGQTASQLFDGLRELALRLLEQFDIRNADEIIPTSIALMEAQQALAQQGGGTISAFGGGNGQAQVPAGAGGLAGPGPGF